VIALAVIAAGALGGLARYLVSRALARSRFPWAVLAVNVAGSAIGGVVLGLAMRAELAADLRLVLLTGFCGGLTTFSTFSVETVQLVLEGRTRTAVLSVAANLGLGIGAAALGCCLALLA
jgi:CrcB protein